MILKNANEWKLATFLAEDYQHMYDFFGQVKLMDSFLYATNSYTNTRDIVKGWVKEPSNFW